MHHAYLNLSIVLLSYAALPPTRQTSALVFLKGQERLQGQGQENGNFVKKKKML